MIGRHGLNRRVPREFHALAPEFRVLPRMTWLEGCLQILTHPVRLNLLADHDVEVCLGRILVPTGCGTVASNVMARSGRRRQDEAA